MRDPRLPPEHTVRAVLAALGAAGIPGVVGGSAVLAAHGVPIAEVRDWDVLVDAEPHAVRAALDAVGSPVERAASPPPAPYASEALFRVDGGDHTVDVIVRFRLRTEAGLIDVPARPGRVWRELPVARADDWVTAYRAMGRADRARALENAD